jgi:hypothetical protein
MNRRFLFVAIAGSVLLLPRFLLAHHSAAAYETTKQITVTGNVTEFHFVNPHVLIYITAKDEGGTVRQWQGEMTSPNHLIRAGWNKDIMKAGDPITLTGYQAKDGGNSIRITKVVLKGQPLSAEIE